MEVLAPELFQPTVSSVREGVEWAFRDVSNPKLRVLILRSNPHTLEFWEQDAREILKGTGATFIRVPRQIRFPSGAAANLGLLTDDLIKYQGYAFGKVLLENFVPDGGARLSRIMSGMRPYNGKRPQLLVGA